MQRDISSTPHMPSTAIAHGGQARQGIRNQAAQKLWAISRVVFTKIMLMGSFFSLIVCKDDNYRLALFNEDRQPEKAPALRVQVTFI